MKFTKNIANVQKTTELIFSKTPLIKQIVEAIAAVGGRSLLVGGAVRDAMLGLPIKDIDIEVHNLTLVQLESILKQFRPVSLVGKSFGVLRLHGLDVDWSLPRADLAGRKPVVVLQPHMQLSDAFRRRDLTINAMGIDLITGDLLDPFGGVHDLEQGILRAPDSALFVEDPLRFYRVMQFIGRFGMQPDVQLNELCKTMDISTVSVERIEMEFEKLLLKSKQPSLGIRWLKSIGRLAEIVPALAATVGVEQNPAWHPEGDVFEHTMQALDAMAVIVHAYADDATKLVLMYAALCHDLGKATTTKKIDGVWRSFAHEHQSALLAPRMLKRLTRKKDLIDDVVKLVRYHMVPNQFVADEVKVSAYKRLANKLAPRVTLLMLADLCLADKQGRNVLGLYPLTTPSPVAEQFRAESQRAEVLTMVEKPILRGSDLIDVCEPGEKMGELLKQAYEIQIEEGIKDKALLRKRILG